MKEIILTEKQFEILKESIKEKLVAARQGVNTHPTEKQCKAGNYAMGHISINGFEISIENPKGSYRCGKDKNGKEWKTLMHNDYGYFTKTVGKDGDAIDVFLGPYLDDKIEDAKIYPIDQYINGEFDETKVMMGFRDKESAKAAYLSNYEKDWKGFKYISEVDIPTFKKWLYDGHRQRKPFAKYVTLTESLNSIVKNGEEKKLRDTVRAMIKDKSLPTDHSLEMAEHYGNIISRAFGIDKDDINYCSDDNRIHRSIIDDEFEKQGGEYDLMDCENHKKCVKKDLEKLHNIKETKNEEGNEIPDKCNKCGGKIELQIHSEPVYICSECGEYFGVKPRGISESMINEKFSSRKLAQLAKEHGGIEVSRNGGNRNGANAWQRGNSIDLSKVTDDMIEGEPFTPEKWAEEPNAICFNDGTMVRLKKYGQQPAPEKVKKPSKYGTGIGDTGDHDKHIGGFKTKDSISQQSAPYNGYGVSDRAGIAQGYHTALKNNHGIIDYFKNHPEREDGYKQSREAMSDISKIHNDVKNDARLSEGKKNNPPKNEVAAINKANREDDIKSHGKSITFRTTMEKNPKAYTRKEKHKKVYMTEEQFKGYCRSLLEQKRKKDYVSNILKESKWYDYDRNEDYTPEGIGGEFEVYYDENEYPITGTYSAHLEEEPQTYDYPGYSEVVLDDVQFNTQVSADFQNQIRELIDDKIKSGENGDIIIEI